MATGRRLEFGNYTLKFGHQKVLLDLFAEVVMPSFHEMRYIRTLKNKGEYFFLDTQTVLLNKPSDEPIIGVAGRLVKNTTLRRDQIFRKDGGLIEDRSELETAPSSTFLLILNNHRLIMCPEVPGAPTLQNFQATSQQFLRRRHKEYIEELYSEAKRKGNKKKTGQAVTKKKLVEEIPNPILRITPIADSESLRGFVDRLQKIDKLSVWLLPTNDEEINNDPFWSDLAQKRDNMNSERAKLEFSNRQNGLDKEEAYVQVHAASALANSEFDFKGEDAQGSRIKGNQDDFNLTLDVEEMPRKVSEAALKKYSAFSGLVKSGAIKLPQVAQHAVEKLKLLSKKL